ncbi:hypothetical protein M501DRAFT_1004704 [Patellaria atrata CBS 101060]|uniref:Uncharacterized protein n=1 Tax=Patellaria atrata CBS 101060 TaxID=1346257 RepID=A0A9P4SA22_9PEZI|nr:hypothetical protein M501DRAFT_1004704 [Patellaria atrata CBS 101060]
MISSSSVLIISGLASLASASKAYTTYTPCADCPAEYSPTPITVTKQYQPITTCSASSSEISYGVYTTEYPCSTYAYVSTVIPCAGPSGPTYTTVTDTAAYITVSHYETTATYTSTPTAYPYPTGYTNATTTSAYPTYTKVTTYDYKIPYHKLGKYAIPGYPGSGLDHAAKPKPDGSYHQYVEVVKCVDDVCEEYVDSWDYTPETKTSTYVVSWSTATYAPTNGVYTFKAPFHSKPYTTSLDNCPKTYTAHAAATKTKTITLSTTVTEVKAYHTSAYASTDGVYTYTLSGSVPYTTSVNHCPKTIPIDYTITKTYTKPAITSCKKTSTSTPYGHHTTLKTYTKPHDTTYPAYETTPPAYETTPYPYETETPYPSETPYPTYPSSTTSPYYPDPSSDPDYDPYEVTYEKRDMADLVPRATAFARRNADQKVRRTGGLLRRADVENVDKKLKRKSVIKV